MFRGSFFRFCTSSIQRGEEERSNYVKARILSLHRGKFKLTAKKHSSDPFRCCHSSLVSSAPRSATLGRFAPSCARPLSWRLPWTYAPRRVGLSRCWGVLGTGFPECNCSQAPKMRCIDKADSKDKALHITHRLLAVLLESFTAEGPNRCPEAENLRIDPSFSRGYCLSHRISSVLYSLHYALQKNRWTQLKIGERLTRWRNAPLFC